MMKYILYAKDPHEAKYQYSVKKREKVGKSIMMILNPLLNTQLISKMFIQILKNIILERNVKY